MIIGDITIGLGIWITSVNDVGVMMMMMMMDKLEEDVNNMWSGLCGPNTAGFWSWISCDGDGDSEDYINGGMS